MLSDLRIKKLARPEKRQEVPDSGGAGSVRGLYLVLQPSGVKSWAVRYRQAGQSRKLTIGPYPTIGLATARRRAKEALGEVAGGKDPAAMKGASKEASRAARASDIDRVESVVEQFIERHARPKTRDWRETERMLVREVVARWKGRRLSQITRAHVHQMLDEIVDPGAPIAANRRFAALRKMCAWAVERGIITVSPCDGVKAPAALTERERVLDDNEVRLVWAAFKSVGWPFGPIGQILLLTGARRNEVAGMQWSELVH